MTGPKHRAYYRSGRPVIKIGPQGALGNHEIRPIHSAPSLGQSIHKIDGSRARGLTCPGSYPILGSKKVCFPAVNNRAGAHYSAVHCTRPGLFHTFYKLTLRLMFLPEYCKTAYYSSNLSRTLLILDFLL